MGDSPETQAVIQSPHLVHISNTSMSTILYKYMYVPHVCLSTYMRLATDPSDHDTSTIRDGVSYFVDE